MIYPLIFPLGQGGWHPNYKSENKNKSQVTTLQYYSYLLNIRNDLSILTQQYIVDA